MGEYVDLKFIFKKMIMNVANSPSSYNKNKGVWWWWLRSKAGISGGSAKLVANVILQNQEKKRDKDNGCFPSLSHPLATKVFKKTKKWQWWWTCYLP